MLARPFTLCEDFTRLVKETPTVIARFCLFFALLSVFLMPVEAQEPPRWVYGDDDTKVLLIATIKPLAPGNRWINKALEAEFASAVGFVLELAPEERNAAKMGRVLAEFGMLGPRNSLDRAIPRSLFRDVQPLLEQADIPEGRYQGFRPWLAAFYARNTALSELGVNSSLSIEADIEDRANQYKRPIIGLETYRDQIATFGGLSLDEELQLVQGTMAQARQMRASLETMTRAWLTGDINTAAREMTAPLAANPRLKEILIDARTARWMPTLKGLLDYKGLYVVAVSAANVVGETGIIARLAADGISAERVTP